MKKKFLIIMMFVACLFSLTACKKNEINLQDYLIEDRQTLFSASDNLSATRADETTIWPDNDLLPDDFDTNYTKEDSEEEETSISDY